VGASLAQIGEFSFILAGLGVSLGLLTPAGQSLILAGALISIALNSLLFAAIEPAQAWARAHSAWARRLDLRDDPLAALPMSTDRKLLTGQVVLVGYGQVGQHIAAALAERHVPASSPTATARWWRSCGPPGAPRCRAMRPTRSCWSRPTSPAPRCWW
jgi:CPA2 family monovalent cation:H+ antiporter-2